MLIMACMRKNSVFIKVVDRLIAFLWTTHLVVMYWRGTWNLLDLYVIPDDLYVGSWISYIGGILLCVFINSLYPYLDKKVLKQNRVGLCLFHLLKMPKANLLIFVFRNINNDI